MYTIGQISKLVNISANALRYYDEISLLKPAGQDKANGYRFYNDAQIKELLTIQELKYYGFSLNEIKDILQVDKSKLFDALEKKLITLKKNHEYDNMRIQIIQERLGGKGMYNDKLIMLVECVSFERMILKEILMSHGYTNIVECSNGKEAIEKYDELKPYLVITSIVMPEIDGLYAFMKIKEKYSDAKFIFCTYMSQLFILNDSVINGCIDFIPKPLSTERIIISVMNAIEKNIATEINTKNIEIIGNEINKYTDGFVKELNLNQEEVDTFLAFARKTDTISSVEFGKYLNGLSTRYDEISKKETGNDKEIDFLKANLNRALQNTINLELIFALQYAGEITDVTTDWVWANIIKDYIISNPNNIFMPIYCGDDLAGCLCYPKDVGFKADEFVIELEKLEKNILISDLFEVKGSSFPTEKMSSHYILSTFHFKQNYAVNMFLSNDVYKLT